MEYFCKPPDDIDERTAIVTDPMLATHPDAPVTVAAIDHHLNNRAYVVPELGDAGDRLFGTR